MIPEVELQLQDGQRVTVGAGAIIGRTYTADVRVDDARVSEVHAYISLRASRFELFALRGRVRCDDRDVPRVELRPGLRVELAPELVLAVVAVRLPSHVLALEADGVTRQVLLGTTSVMTRPRPHLVAGYIADAAALVWSDGRTWRVRLAGQRARTLRGGELVVDGITFRAVEVPTASAELGETVPHTPSERLRLVSQFDSVQVWRGAATEPCVLSGQAARLVAELLALGGPVRWETLARALWSDAADLETLRHRLDVTLGRARRTLDDADVRRDLITSHKNGWLELLLYPGDAADDRA